MNKKKWYILFFISLVFVFLISYEIYKGKISFNFASNNSVINDIYYCEDSSYTLIKTSCTKYIASNPSLLGDVNGDLIVDINDIIIIQDYINENKDMNTKELSIADVNDDSIVDINDIGLIQNYLTDRKGDIGAKKICDDDYEFHDNVCIKKITKEAFKLNYKKGDINKDSKVNMADKLLLKKYLEKESYLSETAIKIADLNNDYEITKDDLTSLNEIIKDNKDKSEVKDSEYSKFKVNADLTVLFRLDQKLKSSYELNSKIDYYFVFDTNKEYYYKYLTIVDKEIIESSDCLKVKNDVLDYFQIAITGKENYGKINFYSDATCDNSIGSYETTKHIKRAE